MFDIGWQELFLIGVVALIVIGPKDLPVAMRAVAKLVRKARAMSQEFHATVGEAMREAELDELREKVNAVRGGGVTAAARKLVDPDGRLTADFDPDEFAAKLKQTVEGGPPRGPASPAVAGAGPAATAQGPAMIDAAPVEAAMVDTAAGAAVRGDRGAEPPRIQTPADAPASAVPTASPPVPADKQPE